MDVEITIKQQPPSLIFGGGRKDIEIELIGMEEVTSPTGIKLPTMHQLEVILASIRTNLLR